MRRKYQGIVGACVALIVGMTSATPTIAQTAILVRHAEKADASADPDLSAQGRARAQALAHALMDVGVTHVVASPLMRTQQTARPAAEAAGVAVSVVAVDGGMSAHVQGVADAVRAAGQEAVVLVVGHNNTVPEIARTLGDPSPEMLQECDFDRLVVMRLDGDGPPAVIRARYGVPSDAC